MTILCKPSAEKPMTRKQFWSAEIFACTSEIVFRHKNIRAAREAAKRITQNISPTLTNRGIENVSNELAKLYRKLAEGLAFKEEVQTLLVNAMAEYGKCCVNECYGNSIMEGED